MTPTIEMIRNSKAALRHRVLHPETNIPTDADRQQWARALHDENDSDPLLVEAVSNYSRGVPSPYITVNHLFALIDRLWRTEDRLTLAEDCIMDDDASHYPLRSDV